MTSSGSRVLATGNDRVLVRNSAARNRAAKAKVFLCVVALGTLQVSPALAQVVEGFIQLPDSLGPIFPPYHVAVDYTPSAERLFVGSDSGDVIVVDAVNFRRIARIPTGPVVSLCYSSTQNKLYAATSHPHAVVVVDCGSYQVVKELPTGDVAWVFYNPLVDRVYVGTPHMKVIDCATDSIVDSLPVVGLDACVALDSARNKLYVGGLAHLTVVDCYLDSVVVVVERMRKTSAICCNSTSGRVYATAATVTGVDETLYAVDTKADSVVSASRMPSRADPTNLTFALRSDPTHNRVYAACRTFVAGFGCGGDTLTSLWITRPPLFPVTVLAYAPELDKVYFDWGINMIWLCGATGDGWRVLLDGTGADPQYLPRLRSLYCASRDGRYGQIDCSGDTVVNVVPLRAIAEGVCLDTVDNKLYFARTEYPGYLGIVDCSAGYVRSIQMCYYPRHMIHNWRENKLYVATWDGGDSWGGNHSGVSVYDCRNDSLVKVIPVGYVRGPLQWHPGLNRVYVGANDSLSQDYIFVIDCVTDSVVRVLPRGTADEGFRCTLLSPELNQFWGFSPHGYTVVDCLKDSIVMDTVTGYRLAMGVSYSAADRKVYVEYTSLSVFSMKSLRPIKSVPLPPQETRGVLVHVAAAGKLYGAVLTSSSTVTDSIYVLDTRTDSIVSRFDAGHMIGAMCEDANGRYVYCTANTQTPPWPESLLVIDTQSDSIVSRTSLPDIDTYGGEWLVPNRRTGRIYVGPGPNGRIAVLRDTVVIGLEEWRETKVGSVVQQTVVSRCVPLLTTAQANLYDASGRKATALRSGLNDISRLAPGVYFIREQPQAASPKSQAMQKVVIAR
jgi:DNA-binding beta-propeller fold protein YncE